MAGGALPMDPPSLAQLLQRLMSAKNEERAEAEEAFDKLKTTQPDLAVKLLAALLRQSPELAIRTFCAVMLRRVLTKGSPPLWANLPPPTQALVKNELLDLLRTEPDKNLAKKVCDIVGELGGLLSSAKEWPELLPFLFQSVQGGGPQQQELALLAFADLAPHMQAEFVSNLPVLQNVLSSTLGSQNLDVALAAMRATTAFVTELEDPAQRAKFQGTIPQQMSVIGRALNAEEESAAQEALELFIGLAEEHPRFLRKHLAEVFAAMLQICEAEALEESTRQLAAEFLVTLCEAREKAPGMMRKQAQLLQRLFACLLGFLLDIEDDPLWHKADSDKYESEGEGNLYDFGQECLDRVSIALGGATIVPMASAALPALLRDGDWRKRHAALICLAQVAEGSVKVLQQNLPGLVDLCMQGLQDSHPKVRWAACQAIGQTATDLGPELQEAGHARLVPGLCAVMDDFSQPRVQAHAAAAIVNFSENCEQELLPPYMGVLIGKLAGMLQHGQKLVQEGALTALASVADCAKEHFNTFYDQVMPLLRHILAAATDKSHALLRAKALECISLVGLAVGRERFRGDAAAVMQLLQQLQAQQLDAEDPTSGYMLQAGARICKCLGPEFLPYLEVVMPSLLASAQLKPDVSISAEDDEGGSGEDELDEDQADVETMYLGNRKVSIRTSVLEEKATACSMLCCYAEELRAGFFPYVEQVAGIMVPLLKFYFHEEVRQAAVQSLPDLLRCALLAAEQGAPGASPAYCQQLLGFMWEPLLKALDDEPEVEVLDSLLESVEAIVERAGPALLPPERLERVMARLRLVIKESRERRAERVSRQAAEDFDAEEAEALEEENEEEEDLLDTVQSLVTQLFKTYGDGAISHIDALMPAVASLLEQSSAPAERRVAICILDDILEYSEQGAARYQAQAAPVLLEGCSHADTNVRQCAVYGLGALAEKRPAFFLSIAPQAMERIVGMITAPEARSEENLLATENAVSALGKVLGGCPQAVGAQGEGLGQLWLQQLPLGEDLVEAKVVHAQLLGFLQAQDARILGQGNSGLPKIVSVVLSVATRGTNVAEADTVKGLVGLLKQLQGAMGPQAWQGITSQLPQQEAATLQKLQQAQAL